MSEHTPTPWKLAGSPDNMIVCDDEGGSVADCAPPGPWMRHTTALENAAFIVEAVNSHEALVAENERLRSQLVCMKSALDLAVNMVMEHELPDSRAVSDEAVALAAVAVGDMSEPVMAVICAALADEDDCSCGGGTLSGHDTACPYALSDELREIPETPAFKKG